MIFKGLSFAFMGAVVFASVAAHAQQITSTNDVRFIDGDNLIIEGKSIALYAIKVPELGTYCDDKKQKYDCGLISRSSLMDLSAGARLVCSRAPAPYDREKYKCLSNGYDLSEGMVYTGWATPLEKAPVLFKKLAREAQEKRRGMWRFPAR